VVAVVIVHLTLAQAALVELAAVVAVLEQIIYHLLLVAQILVAVVAVVVLEQVLLALGLVEVQVLLLFPFQLHIDQQAQQLVRQHLQQVAVTTFTHLPLLEQSLFKEKQCHTLQK
jgi:hypothetical protein